MFFTIHNEQKIGYKCLTDADLGRRHTSHQTHIGLFDDVLTFLPNNAELDDAMLIYKHKCAICKQLKNLYHILSILFLNLSLVHLKSMHLLSTRLPESL